jgi:hypothetical protein
LKETAFLIVDGGGNDRRLDEEYMKRFGQVFGLNKVKVYSWRGLMINVYLPGVYSKL